MLTSSYPVVQSSVPFGFATTFLWTCTVPCPASCKGQEGRAPVQSSSEGALQSLRTRKAYIILPFLLLAKLRFAWTGTVLCFARTSKEEAQDVQSVALQYQQS